jgi:acyl carrier protein
MLMGLRERERVMHRAPQSIDEFVMAKIASVAHFHAEEVVRQTRLEELGVDSLGLATIAAFVEAEFDCAFTSTQLASLYSAARVADVVLAVREAVCGETGQSTLGVERSLAETDPG